LPKKANEIIFYDANIGKNKTIFLPGVINEHAFTGESYMPETPANIYYRLIENTRGFQYSRVHKIAHDFYMGFDLGMQNFPYSSFILGYNGKTVEVGGAMFWGLTIDRASYEGMWFFRDYPILGSEDDTTAHYEILQDSELEYVKLKKAKIFHPYGGIVFYASSYMEKFALNYAASISSPWLLIRELPASKSYDADISFQFPILLMQDIGISYTPHRIKYRLGVNQITGVKFHGQYWGFNIQMAYLLI